MLHHHLPHLLSPLAAFARHALNTCHAVRRLIGVGLCRLGVPARAGLQTSFGRRGSSRKRRARQRRPVLIHYHIFKNAGTSFEWALRQGLRGGVRILDTSSHDGFVSARDIAAYLQHNPKTKVIMSHQAAPPPPRLRGREVLTSILIRDPIARIRSIYAFERSQPEDIDPTRKAKELDFKRYVEWRLEATPRMFCDFQVHFCCRRGATIDAAPNVNDLDQAILALDAINIVGTVERYEEWLALAQSVLANYYPSISLIASRQNALSGGTDVSKAGILHDLVTDLGEELAYELLQRNELDMRLYQIADALLSRKLAERHVHVALQQVYESAKRQRLSARSEGSSSDS